MTGGDTALGFLLPGILMESDSEEEPANLKTEYDLQLESRIKTEIPDSCSQFFTLVTIQPPASGKIFRMKELCNAK